MGYQPNALGAGLQGAQSNLVAIFVGEMTNPYDAEVSAQLLSGLNAAGKYPIVISGSGDVARDAISNVLRYPLEAMILRSGSMDQDVVSSCLKLNIPVISSGRVIDAPEVDNICVRNALGMQRMTETLIARGRRAFAYVGGPASFGSAAERRAGFDLALAGAGLSPVSILQGDYSVQSGHAALASLPSLAGIDAVVCANDAMAIGALTFLNEANRSDISVVGFDDISMAQWPMFNLTTVRNPIDQLVSAVTRLLSQRVETPTKAGETIWIEPELVLRGSH